MTKPHFSLQEIFVYGWNKTRQHAWFIFLTFIITSIIINAVQLTLFLDTVVTLMAALSIVAISMKIVRNHDFTFGDLFTPLLSPNKVLKFFALVILYILPVALALSVLGVGLERARPDLLVIGIFLAMFAVYTSISFKFFPYVVLEHEHANLQDLIKTSYKLTSRQFLPVFSFVAISGLLNCLAALPYLASYHPRNMDLLALLVTVPVSIFATAHVYDKLKEHSM